MIELAAASGGGWALNHGGDTYNTAAYLARWGWNVSYLTALGADHFSHSLRTAWTRDGVDLSLTLTHPDRIPGLYAINTTESGERSFLYWRERSAARALFDLPNIEAALREAARADVLQLSGVTLSLFSPNERAKLRALARAVRDKGGLVVFDPNYRPSGWSGPDEAREAFSDLAPLISVVLPSFDDEQGLWGDADPPVTIARWMAMGPGRVVVKDGSAGAWLRVADEDRLIRSNPVAAVDTSGAGDAFNAAFLAASNSLPPVEAVGVANRFAALSLMNRGAIMARDKTPSWEDMIEAEPQVSASKGREVE